MVNAPQPTQKAAELTPAESRARKITRAESVIALLGSFAMLVNSQMANTEKSDDTYDKDAESHLVDSMHSFPRGKRMRNLGVLHSNSQFAKHERHFRAAIDQCDVLLTEDHTGNFFEQLADYALSRKKKVIDIDVYSSVLQQLSESGMCMGALALAGEQAYAEWKRHKSGDAVLGTLHTRRNMLRVLFSAGAAATVFHGFDNSLESGNARSQSFFTRGRTAAMFDESQKIMRASDDKNYLLMTGDGHAKIIEDYCVNPQSLARDLERFKSQFAFFGRGIQVVRAKTGA